MAMVAAAQQQQQAIEGAHAIADQVRKGRARGHVTQTTSGNGWKRAERMNVSVNADADAEADAYAALPTRFPSLLFVMIAFTEYRNHHRRRDHNYTSTIAPTITTVHSLSLIHI